KLPEGTMGDYPFSFRLTTDSDRYAASETFTLLITNEATPTPGAPEPTATPTPTATPPGTGGCTGDCDANGRVSVDQPVRGGAASGAWGVAPMCPALDLDGDGDVEISELVSAVNASIHGCGTGPAATLDQIQQTIFTPTCAVATCHDSQFKSGNLILADADT